jgi:hypothetical protein
VHLAFSLIGVDDWDRVDVAEMVVEFAEDADLNTCALLYVLIGHMPSTEEAIAEWRRDVEKAIAKRRRDVLEWPGSAQ